MPDAGHITNYIIGMFFFIMAATQLSSGREGRSVGSTPGIVRSHVTLQSPKGKLCSGTLIAKDKVLTAAHCVQIPFPENTWLVSTLDNPVRKSVVIKVELHPKSQDIWEGKYFDSAIVQLANELSDNVAELSYDELQDGDTIQFTGVGTTKITGYDKDNQPITDEPSLNQVQVLTSTYEKNENPDWTISAPASDDHTSLPGDSGGGIYRDGKLVGNVASALMSPKGHYEYNVGPKLDKEFIEKNLDPNYRYIGQFIRIKPQ
jgi:V8-like Glu-specific endopeptidase